MTHAFDWLLLPLTIADEYGLIDGAAKIDHTNHIQVCNREDEQLSIH